MAYPNISYPRAYVELIRNTVPMSLVVQSFDIPIRTQNAAREIYRCCCPFHQEKTPSFLILDQKRIFTCFGCGERGDLFYFISKMKGWDTWGSREWGSKYGFKRAVEYAARHWGVYPSLPRNRRLQKK